MKNTSALIIGILVLVLVAFGLWYLMDEDMDDANTVTPTPTEAMMEENMEPTEAMMENETTPTDAMMEEELLPTDAMMHNEDTTDEPTEEPVDAMMP